MQCEAPVFVFQRHISMRQAPFVPTHVIGRFQERVEDLDRDSTLQRIQWGYFNGNEIKHEPDGDCHILIEYNRHDGTSVQVVLIVAPCNDADRREYGKTHIVRTVLTLDFYKANNACSLRGKGGKRKAVKRKHYFNSVPRNIKRSPTRVRKEELRRRDLDDELRNHN